LMWELGSPRYATSSSQQTLGTLEVGLTSGSAVYVKSVGLDGTHLDHT
jgi:hypothetical protein